MLQFLSDEDVPGDIVHYAARNNFVIASPA